MTLTGRPWLFRISQKPNPTNVYFSSPDPAMAFLSASASFSGSKLSAGFNVPWNSAWKKEFEMHKVQVTVRATCTSVRWILHWREHVKANVLLWVPEVFYSLVRRVLVSNETQTKLFSRGHNLETSFLQIKRLLVNSRIALVNSPNTVINDIELPFRRETWSCIFSYLQRAALNV